MIYIVPYGLVRTADIINFEPYVFISCPLMSYGFEILLVTNYL